jgi:hypothetical protein
MYRGATKDGAAAPDMWNIQFAAWTLDNGIIERVLLLRMEAKP